MPDANGPLHNEGAVPVRCYATPNFAFATLVAYRSDLTRFFAKSGCLQISSSQDETVLLNFCPTAVTVLADALGSIVSASQIFERNPLAAMGQGLSDLVLVFGRVLAVELLVPSHAIDVMATTQRGGLTAFGSPMLGIGLN